MCFDGKVVKAPISRLNHNENDNKCINVIVMPCSRVIKVLTKSCGVGGGGVDKVTVIV